MKKNKAMRLASVLLVLTLLTTCMTAGTFAKYTTGAEGTSTARVAKFGVNVSVDASKAFGEKYGDENAIVTSKDTGVTVDASDNKEVVAPGTKGEITFSITGTPETKVDLSISLDDENTLKEVKLTKGTYKDVTTGKEITLEEDYYPVQWTLKDKNGNIIGGLENKKLSEIETYLKGNDTIKEYAPNTDLKTLFANNASSTGEYILSWKWPIGDDTVNQKDTLLGNIQSDTKLVEKKDSQKTEFAAIQTTDYCLEEAFKLTISVTQVD